MFNDKYGLTEAVLEGRKTQTRRLILQKTIEKAEQYRVDYFNDTLDNIPLEDMLIEANQILGVPSLSSYHVGEEVAIAQSYHALNRLGYLAPEGLDHYCEGSAGYDNKMFVEAELMPHRIKITNIRVERLQDISDDDCLKEGIKRKNERYCVENYKGVCFYTNDPKLAFRCLIDKTCGKGTWDKNPWVFVYDFKCARC